MMGQSLGRGQSPLPSIIKFKNTCISTESEIFYPHEKCQTIFARQWRHSLRNDHYGPLYFLLVPISLVWIACRCCVIEPPHKKSPPQRQYTGIKSPPAKVLTRTRGYVCFLLSDSFFSPSSAIVENYRVALRKENQIKQLILLLFHTHTR